eukprot:TRINITY_DN17165_c0_g1_i1.p1 TRINITY_DN17165_c0_g1~~TRINITY_DN17165_c0_g1_i1.p1  ORF type:complete len:376 (+),score=119.50 TRINITY_DN17165_c0_g1_i1:24-1130(+)
MEIKKQKKESAELKNNPLFVKYNSIDAPNEKTIYKLKEGGFLKGEWVATEKIHGANFSFVTDGEIVECAKRTSMLKENSTQFYNWEEIRKSHREMILKIFEEVKKLSEEDEKLKEKVGRNEEKLTVSVYGELFGGIYPHKDVPKIEGVKHIQKGVYYCPDIKFCAFDIRVKKSGFLDFDVATKIFETSGILYTKALMRGTFDQLYTFDVENFKSTLPSLFNLPLIEGNVSEGVIIKPVINVSTDKGRVILKLKSDKFKEVTGVNKPPKNKPKGEVKDNTPPHLIEIKEKALCYINKNRLSNVISKEEEITMSDVGRLIGLLAKDAFEDFIKDNEEEWNNVKVEERKIIKKAVAKASAGVVSREIDEFL